MEAQNAQIAMQQQRAAVALNPEGMGGVVDHLEVVVIRDALDSLHITGEAVAVHRKNCRGARRDARFDGSRPFQLRSSLVATNENGVVITSPCSRSAFSAINSASVPFANREMCSTPR